MDILFLCRQKDLGWGQASLARALERRGARITCVKDDTRLNEKITQLYGRRGNRPSLILQPELDFPLLPQGLTDIDIPTACLQIDTYAYTERRIGWSMLYDHPIVFHPGYQDRFERAGHPGVITFSHAACRDLFDKPPVDRIFDVGSVGRTNANVQITRRRVLTELAGRFRLNEWEKFYSFEEMAEVYRHSKVVVNVPRDDFLHDANMRAFEAMAAGCLLISRFPTELTAIGFREGVHFVAYRREDEIVDLVQRYLRDDAGREQIARAGRQKVLAEHTYDCRAEQLMKTVEQHNGKLFAPARGWPQDQVRLVQLDYFAANARLDYAYGELRRIAIHDLRSAASGSTIIARAFANKVRGRLDSLLQWNK
jgi:Glycosyl transferases group 1